MSSHVRLGHTHFRNCMSTIRNSTPAQHFVAGRRSIATCCNIVALNVLRPQLRVYILMIFRFRDSGKYFRVGELLCSWPWNFSFILSHSSGKFWTRTLIGMIVEIESILWCSGCLGSAQALLRLCSGLLALAPALLRHAHPQLRLKQQLLTSAD